MACGSIFMDRTPPSLRSYSTATTVLSQPLVLRPHKELRSVTKGSARCFAVAFPVAAKLTPRSTMPQNISQRKYFIKIFSCGRRTSSLRIFEKEHAHAANRTPGSPISLPVRAFAKYGTHALWNRRMLEAPLMDDALVVADALRTGGDLEARHLGEQVESKCHAGYLRTSVTTGPAVSSASVN